jgi:hypothetical protein
LVAPVGAFTLNRNAASVRVARLLRKLRPAVVCARAWAGTAPAQASAGEDSRGAYTAMDRRRDPELNGEVHDHTTTGAVKDLNSGGHVLLLSPGIRIAYGAFSGFALSAFRSSTR